MPHLPIIDMFRRGDILLVRSNKIQSKLIRTATGGEFSHAMICVDPPTMIEAVPGHVRNITLARCYVEDVKNICVLRYPDEGISKTAGREASLWLDTPYSFLAAFCSIPATPLITADGGIFCSRLVAEAFRKAGGNFLHGCPTGKITPAAIESESILKNITKLLFEIAPDNYRLDKLSALDVNIPQWIVDPLSEKRRDCAQDLIPALQLFERAHLPGKRIWPSFMRIIELLVTEAENLPLGTSLKRTDLVAIDTALFSAIRKNSLEISYHEIIEKQDSHTRELLLDSFSPNPSFDIDSIKQSVALSARVDRREQSANRLNEIAVRNGFSGLELYSLLEKKVVESMRYMEQISIEVIARRGA